MELIEKIRAEIERLKAKYRKDMYKSNYEGLVSGYKIEAYNELLCFLDTLQEPKFDLDRLREVAVPLSDEEKEAHRKMMDERRKKYEEMGILQEPEVDLEKEIRSERKKLLDIFGPMNGEQSLAIEKFAHHFYKLGKNAK